MLHNEYLYQAMIYNCESDADHINITMKAEWAYVEEPLHFYVFPWSKATVQSYTHEQITEATEEDYALWHVRLVLAPQEGFAFENPQVWLNNGRFTGTLQPDGTLLVEFLFDDLSYRPFDYYGDDIGMIFNPEFYAFNYPEVAKACEYDPEMLADHFCDEGMYEGYIGNGFFDPQLVLLCHPKLINTLGEDWSLYYWDFLFYGYEEEAWLTPANAMFAPPVIPYEAAAFE